MESSWLRFSPLFGGLMIMNRQEIRKLSAHFLPRDQAVKVDEQLAGQIRGLLKVLDLTVKAAKIDTSDVVDAIDRIIERESSPLKTYETTGITAPRQHTAEEVGFLKALQEARVAFGKPVGD
jgi:hypothetical protein